MVLRGLALLWVVVSATSVHADPVVIQNVPQMGWLVGETCQRISALASALNAMGCPADYDELMVDSGAAFATAWWLGHYDYAVIWASPEDLVLNGAQSVGAEAERVDFAAANDMWDEIRASIDEGRPILAWHGAGARIICGYDPDGMVVYTQTNANDSGDYQPVPLDNLDQWAPMLRPNSLVFPKYDPETERPERDWHSILERAVAFADWPEDEKLYGRLTFGLAAYDGWAQTLRGRAPATALKLVVHINGPAARVVADARKAAAGVLLEVATLHDGFSEAADHYLAEAEILNQIGNVLPSPTEVWDMSPDDLQWEQAAQLVEHAKAEEAQAVDALRVALGDLWGEAPDQTPAPGAQQRAEEHCRRGKQLQAQRRYAEGAEELAAAIAADPEHVEAHWVLAWVRIELQDREGAVGAFREVVRLDSDGDLGTEAQRALERLGR